MGARKGSARAQRTLLGRNGADGGRVKGFVFSRSEVEAEWMFRKSSRGGRVAVQEVGTKDGEQDEV